MASVVFMRAVNVGGHQVCKPTTLAKTLSEFGLVNVGAAGTFVVKEKVPEAKLRKKITEAMGLEVEMMICSAEEIMQLVKSKPFGPKLGKHLKSFVSVMARPPRKPPDLPIDQPPGKWGVRIVAVKGRFALCLWRRLEGQTMVYPNAVVEKKLGVAATTRNWNTMVSVAGNLVEARQSETSRG
jgi:uncharacterized protein (DUF1697 family)